MATSRGMDVSAYQSAQDWADHRRNGVVFAFAKASEGQRSRDERFDTHIAGIIKAGLVPGAYHFAWPTQPVATEADNYISAVRPYARRGFCHWLDLERYSDGRNYGNRTATQIRTWVSRWLATVADAFPGQRVGVYTGASDVAAGHLPAGVPLWFPRYPWGPADWSRAEDQAQPVVDGRRPLIWQFTSQPYDRSIAYLSEAGLRAWAQGETPEEDDMPTAAEIAAEVIKQLPDAVWAKDGAVPAARPPVHNGDYYKADGKTLDNTEWTAGYALQTAVEGVRKTQKQLGAVAAQIGALAAAVAALAQDGGLPLAQVQAAAEAGAKAALAELGDKLQED
ncbi:glycoside hydrolase family 25 protein [Streptomyces gilvus]|uniref:glycoside hydrolase family 25 protein n=1 Tax=Streptomyces gilvus TaxID=2920937 RepID=UPI001F0F5863|nr:glycoside hydrolase family 25 protein [Streptomyces sp. CME 23]MCH5677822.1 glycoside hydrolase family 25 protein [Streptomyces sp. CME 23]